MNLENSQPDMLQVWKGLASGLALKGEGMMRRSPLSFSVGRTGLFIYISYLGTTHLPLRATGQRANGSRILNYLEGH